VYKRDFNSFLDPVHQIRRIKSWKFKRQVVYFVPVPKVYFLNRFTDLHPLANPKGLKDLIAFNRKILSDRGK